MRISQLRGNHNGGVLRFGPDGKLYILMGDNGRRGLLAEQSVSGPVSRRSVWRARTDNNHLTGFILRLNDDGSTPTDNPFFNAVTSPDRRRRTATFRSFSLTACAMALVWASILIREIFGIRKTATTHLTR